jgi:hypothetical protein
MIRATVIPGSTHSPFRRRKSTTIPSIGDTSRWCSSSSFVAATSSSFKSAFSFATSKS